MSTDLYTKIGSYSEEDVKFLLKDLSHVQLEGSAESREKRIQSGEHYSESLPIEYHPPQEYIELFYQTLHDYKKTVAYYVGVVAEQIYRNKGKETVLVSLARAGTPIGILIRRYLHWKYGISLPHYSVSIIRGRGLDYNAIKYILAHHPEGKIQFIDGWTGKGAISIELTKSVRDIQEQYGVELDDTLAVLADPGHCTTLYGTRDDFIIPSACLNSTVSGLVSRTVLNQSYIGPDDFHGAKYYRELESSDLSNEFLDIIAGEFVRIEEEAIPKTGEDASFSGLETVKRMMADFQINDINLVKPGVGETTRVLLRRVPWKVLIKDMDSPYLKHILMLCEEKNIEILAYPDMEYTCCGLIKNVGDV
ncbi:cysteine protease StiP family protein [Robertmurraya andreesenii]|uniref:PELOTA RNA-binding domain-containing protein n=1 Tax=Anoxybacillus andreesenii TaxID=1325932 RepID=A0ABT9V2E4_9BACL|nr:cysteine protease StiP family protein [Robertmurraya andreesenii]MDQ0155122.1 hypothetical protein [Robertmurraya andreesenii]